jgi:hypothetical protein
LFQITILNFISITRTASLAEREQSDAKSDKSSLLARQEDGRDQAY